MRPKKQKALVFENTCSCLVDYLELEKAMLWISSSVIKSKRKIFLNGQYPAVTIGDKKHHIHRLLMMYWSKNKNIPSNIYVHHKNHNKFDSTKENLEFIDPHTHQSMHNKGKIISHEHKLVITNWNNKRWDNYRRLNIHDND